MVELFKDFQEVCVDRITATNGQELEISANLTDPDQVDLVLESYLYGPLGLNSRYVPARNEMYLRLSCSFHGRLRDDIVAIGKTPRYDGGSSGSLFGSGGDD